MNRSLWVLSCLMVSIAAQAEPSRILCAAGVTLPKHNSEYLGQPAPSKEEAEASAMEECRRRSAFAADCRVLTCFTDDRD